MVKYGETHKQIPKAIHKRGTDKTEDAFLKVVTLKEMQQMAPYPSGKQWSVLALAPFNTFVSDKDSGIEHFFSKFTDDTKLCGTINTLQRRDAIQGDLDRFEGPNMKLNKVKFCTWVKAIPGTNTGWAKNGLRTVLKRRTWGCW